MTTATTKATQEKKILPLHHCVLVRPDAEPTHTRGGIALPDNRDERHPRLGEVLAAGPGTTKQNGVKIPMQVGRGDRIMYGRFAGTEVEQDGEKLRLVNQDEILALVE